MNRNTLSWKRWKCWGKSYKECLEHRTYFKMSEYFRQRDATLSLVLPWLAPKAFMSFSSSVTCTLGYLLPVQGFPVKMTHPSQDLSFLPQVSRNESFRWVASLLAWMKLGLGMFSWKIREWVSPRKGNGEVMISIIGIGNRIIRESGSPGIEWFKKIKKTRSKLWMSIFARVWRQELMGYVDFR